MAGEVDTDFLHKFGYALCDLLSNGKKGRFTGKLTQPEGNTPTARTAPGARGTGGRRYTSNHVRIQVDKRQTQPHRFSSDPTPAAAFIRAEGAAFFAAHVTDEQSLLKLADAAMGPFNRRVC